MGIIDDYKFYHLVMTNSSPWKDPPCIFKNGKPSISIRAIEKPWRTVRKSQFLRGKPSISMGHRKTMANC